MHVMPSFISSPIVVDGVVIGYERTPIESTSHVTLNVVGHDPAVPAAPGSATGEATMIGQLARVMRAFETLVLRRWR